MIRTLGAAALLALATTTMPQPAAAQNPLGGAIVGGVLGGVVGGAVTGGRGGGILLGAAVGATTGAIIASEAQRRRGGYYYWNRGCYALGPDGYYHPIPRRYC